VRLILPSSNAVFGKETERNGEVLQGAVSPRMPDSDLLPAGPVKIQF
jgi:hypothetical protein